MDVREKMQRQQVVDEALTWLGTPYHHQGFVKGAGVDCGFLLIKVFHNCGLIPDIDPRPYPHDWHMHRSEQRYLGWVEKYAERITDRDFYLPGDIMLYQFGRCISHGAIVIDYPTVIHSYINLGVLTCDCTQDPLGKRFAGAYRLRGWS